MREKIKKIVKSDEFRLGVITGVSGVCLAAYALYQVQDNAGFKTVRPHGMPEDGIQWFQTFTGRMIKVTYNER